MRDLNNERERLLEAVNRGRVLSIAWSQIAPVLVDIKLSTMTRAVQDFRAGKPPAELQHHIATLASLEDLETRLRAIINRGEGAAKELNNETKSTS